METKDRDIQEFNPFEGFNPDLPDSRVFIERVEDRIDAVESVKEKLHSESRSTGRAAWIAAITGFVTGLASSIICPKLYVIFQHIFADTTDDMTELTGSVLFTCIVTAVLTITAVFYTFRSIRTGKI